jgi:hypothetical protein
MKFQGKNFFLEYAEHSEEWTKATLTREEFEDFREKEEKLKKVTTENRDKDLEITRLENIINKIKTEVETFKNEQTLLKSELEKKISLLENQNKILTSQNENLLRINRERSNAERKLYPKKLHNGYIVLHQESYNKIFSFKVRGDMRGTFKNYSYNLLLYKYRLETPYLCNIELDSVKKLIIQDLKKYYHLEYLKELPRSAGFFEQIDFEKLLLNLKISTSERFYFIEFSSNVLIKEKES